jgi:RNA polymerase subunit RPABC4/transcription elongation factor Spt4
MNIISCYYCKYIIDNNPSNCNKNLTINKVDHKLFFHIIIVLEQKKSKIPNKQTYFGIFS